MITHGALKAFILSSKGGTDPPPSREVKPMKFYE